jgi:hypothetical protein
MINNCQLVLELALLAHFPQRTGESRIAECGPLLHARSMKIISLVSSIHGRYAAGQLSFPDWNSGFNSWRQQSAIPFQYE